MTLSTTELINAYGITSSQRVTWLNLLLGQNISHFIFRFNAMNEWNSGTSPGITPVKNMITDANAKGIQVSVDLHTWYTTWDSYFRDSASNSASNRTAYINYVRNVLTALQGTNVYSFMVLNEPQARTASSSENSFIRSIISNAKLVAGKPVSVRFMGGYSPSAPSISNPSYSAQIDTDCDFLCRNSYWDPRNPNTSVYGCSQQNLLDTKARAISQGKEFWITEFGNNGTVSSKTSYVQAFVAWAKQQTIHRIYCWVCQLGSGESYNILTGDGTVTPLGGLSGPFYQLTNGAMPTTYTLTVNYVDVNANAIATPTTQPVNAGSTITVTAPPISGYKFSHWQDGSTTPWTSVMNANLTLTATYVADVPPSPIALPFHDDFVPPLDTTKWKIQDGSWR